MGGFVPLVGDGCLLSFRVVGYMLLMVLSREETKYRRLDLGVFILLFSILSFFSPLSSVREGMERKGMYRNDRIKG